MKKLSIIQKIDFLLFYQSCCIWDLEYRRNFCYAFLKFTTDRAFFCGPLHTAFPELYEKRTIRFARPKADHWFKDGAERIEVAKALITELKAKKEVQP